MNDIDNTVNKNNIEIVSLVAAEVVNWTNLSSLSSYLIVNGTGGLISKFIAPVPLEIKYVISVFLIHKLGMYLSTLNVWGFVSNLHSNSLKSYLFN